MFLGWWLWSVMIMILMLMFQGFVAKFSDGLFRCSRPFWTAISDVAEFSNNSFRCSQGYLENMFDVVKGSWQQFSMYQTVITALETADEVFSAKPTDYPRGPRRLLRVHWKLFRNPNFVSMHRQWPAALETDIVYSLVLKFCGNPNLKKHQTPGVKSFQCSHPGILHWKFFENPNFVSM